MSTNKMDFKYFFFLIIIKNYKMELKTMDVEIICDVCESLEKEPHSKKHDRYNCTLEYLYERLSQIGKSAETAIITNYMTIRFLVKRL